MEAIRYWPCLRIGTSTTPSVPGVGAGSGLRGHVFQGQDLVAEQPLRLLDAALQVAHRGHLAQIDADRHKRLRDLGRQARDDDRRAQQSGRLDRLDRKSTRLNSSHVEISYAVFCLKKK